MEAADVLAAPRRPEKPRGLAPGQPALAWRVAVRPPIGRDDAQRAVVGIVVPIGQRPLEYVDVGARHLRALGGRVGAAVLGGDLGRPFRAPPPQDAVDVVGDLFRGLEVRRGLGRVDVHRVRDQRVVCWLGRVLLHDVRGEDFFSFSTVILAAASADERRAVSDSPLLPRLVEVEPRRGSPSWHSRTISFIARGVV